MRGRKWKAPENQEKIMVFPGLIRDWCPYFLPQRAPRLLIHSARATWGNDEFDSRGEKYPCDGWLASEGG